MGKRLSEQEKVEICVLLEAEVPLAEITALYHINPSTPYSVYYKRYGKPFHKANSRTKDWVGSDVVDTVKWMVEAGATRIPIGRDKSMFVLLPIDISSGASYDVPTPQAQRKLARRAVT